MKHAQSKNGSHRLVDRTLRKFLLSDAAYNTITDIATKKRISRVAVIELSIVEYAKQEQAAI